MLIYPSLYYVSILEKENTEKKWNKDWKDTAEIYKTSKSYFGVLIQL